ncbi:MAG: AAA family ATPase [Promethearchaeota archaeon]
MIKKLAIKSFKSINSVEFECNRINVFIGPPNTGKSNILEALAYLSYFFRPKSKESFFLENFVRFNHRSDLFYDNEVSQSINIKFDDFSLQIKYKDNLVEELYNQDQEITLEDYSGPPIRYYKFIDREIFNSSFPDFLLPSDGINLFFLLLTHKHLRELVSDILKPFDLSLGLRKTEYKIEISKTIDGITISYPYKIISDTLKRLIFHIIAIETNSNSVIIFEEPEVHAFPYYTKFFAEKVALNKDTNNQYFFSTHNPYFLMPLLQKAKDVNVYATRWENFQTKLYLLNNEDILSYDSDIFFNLDNMVEDRNE